MHDRLGHRLSLISLYAGALELSSGGTGPAPGAGGGGGEAQLIRSTVQTAMRELRTVLGVLRSPGDAEEADLRPVEESGLRPDIERLVGQSRSAGIEVRLTWRGDDLRGVAVPVRQAVHRVVREGLANVHRHTSGAAVTVEVERRTDAVRMTVCNGAGTGTRPPLPGTGLGLIGVEERVAMLGGEFSAGPEADGGFSVTAELPLHTPAEPVTGGPPEAATRPATTPAPADHRPWPGTSAVLALGLVGVAALIVVALTSLPWYVSQPTPDRPPPVRTAEIGMTRAQASAAIGPDDVLAGLAARSVESPRPSGSDCVYGQDWLPDGRATIVRYCFLQDRLIRKDRYHVGGDSLVTGTS
ncbi:histidine kinase [Streptomyces sp. AS02]|nr:histidine kinase [Streptomyces sp. AS02]